jgi:phospho-N-acetylmuramoyl-pentapeptide-transferase
VDAKLFSVKSLTLSGTRLFWLLAIALTAIAFIFDVDLKTTVLGGRSLLLPLLLCSVVTAALGSWVIPMLVRLKTGQVIREDGPQAHLKKAGTPTMGGVFFIPVAVLIGSIWSGFSPEALAVCALTVAYGFIGWLDDWQILRLKSNKGISPKMKLGLQVLFGALFCLWLALTQPSTLSAIALPFGIVLPLGFLFWPIAEFVLVAESNATNLTDGVDGLMGGTGAIAFLGLAALVAPTHPDLALLCACFSGSCLGFVAHNRNPARVFMGDTGSLALGGALAAIALTTNTLWGLFLISGLFFVESLSVIAQVLYYKATKGPDGIGKRLLKMAPLHHHLELSGWSELEIVGSFYAISMAAIFLALLLH